MTLNELKAINPVWCLLIFD